jgi:hypothetical protein
MSEASYRHVLSIFLALKHKNHACFRPLNTNVKHNNALTNHTAPHTSYIWALKQTKSCQNHATTGEYGWSCPNLYPRSLANSNRLPISETLADWKCSVHRSSTIVRRNCPPPTGTPTVTSREPPCVQPPPTRNPF